MYYIFVTLILILVLRILQFRKHIYISEPKKEFTLKETINAMKFLGIEYRYDMYKFNKDMNEELSHGKKYPKCNLTNDDPIKTAQIVWAHYLDKVSDTYPEYF